MTLALLDARQWQQAVDLRSGRPTEAVSPLSGMVGDILARHPFPGDRDGGSNAWVTDTALDFVARYDPGFAFLAYAQQYYSSRYGALAPETRRKYVENAFAEAARFARESGMTTVLVGTGDLVPATTPIDLEDLDGLAVASNWCAHYAGLYDLSDRDREALARNPHLTRIVPRQELLDLFGGGPEDGGRLPDFMAVACRGGYFKGSSLRRLVMVPEPSAVIPVSQNLGPAASILDIRPRLLELLEAGNRVALALLEGVGCAEFQPPYTTCANGKDWFRYEPGDAQYLALTTGRHPIFEHNGGYRYYLDDGEHKPYPFSGYFKELPGGTIGEAYPGRSIAVGNRSMFMHVCTGCDVTCECFARNLYNQGLMSVIFRDDKVAR